MVEVADIQKVFTERAIKRVKVGGTDIDGILRGKYLSTEKFWSAIESGFGICDVVFGWDISDDLYHNSELTGWHTGYPDALAKIDLSSMRMLEDEPHVAHFLVDFYLPDGAPHPACPRNLLKRIIAQALKSELRPYFSYEFEFWMFRETSQSLREKGFRNLEALSSGMCGYSWLRTGQVSKLVAEIHEKLSAYGIALEGIHTETGPGVWEVAIKYDDALRAADQAVLLKTTIKQLLHRDGIMATFMAKWNDKLPGSSGHLHQSLWDKNGDKNLMRDRSGGLSELAQHYLAGQLHLLPELTALYAPFANSYKRFVPGAWAPLNVTWGTDNRTCAARVILGQSEKSTHIELRVPAADTNPYLAMAGALASGLHGIANKTLLSAETKGDATALAADQAPLLPRSLDTATTLLKRSATARKILGADFIDHYVRTREWEVGREQRAVTDWEISRYFEAV